MSTRISNTVATSSSMVDVPMTSLADCSAVCKHLGDCEAVTYINGACNIFSAVTSTSQSDSVDYIKTTCTNGDYLKLTKLLLFYFYFYFYFIFIFNFEGVVVFVSDFVLMFLLMVVI